MTGAGNMLAASHDPEYEQLLERARAAFNGHSLDETTNAEMHGFNEFTNEIEYYLVGRTWFEIVSTNAFLTPNEKTLSFDLVEIPTAIWAP